MGVGATDSPAIEIITGMEYVKIQGMTPSVSSKPKRNPTRDNIQGNESMLANILNNAAEAILFLDESQRILSFNKSAEAIFGYAPGEVVGKPLDILIPPRFVEAHRKHMVNFSESPEASRSMTERREIYGLRKNGEEFPAEASIAKLEFNGRLVFSVFLRDITNRKRADLEMRLLLKLTQIIAESEDFDSALEQTMRVICENAGWDLGEIWILSDNGKQLELGSPCFYKDPSLEGFRRKSIEYKFTSETGLPGRVWSSGKAAFIPDTTLDTNFLRADIAREFGLKAAMGIPVFMKNRLVAVMVFFMSEIQQEDEGMMTLISAIAAQLGTAFRRKQAEAKVAKLYNALEQSSNVIRKRLRESEALSQIAHSLGEAERIGLMDLLDLIAASAKKLVSGAEQAVIHLLDEQGEILIPKAVTGLSSSNEGKKKMRLGEGVAGQAIESGDTINIADVKKDGRFLKSDFKPTYRSLMAAPISSGERKLGTISVQSKIPYAFTQSDGRLLRSLGNHAAIALENARLLENTRQALKEANALYYVTQGLAAFNADDLLKDVVELLQVNFGYYHVQVYIIEPKTGDLFLHAASGEVGRKLHERKHRLGAGTGIVGRAAETSSPLCVNNVNETEFFVRNPLLPETQSEMAIPVKVGGQLFGILDIQQAPPKTFTLRDQQLLSAVAGQLAISLQKAKLYEDLKMAHQQEKAMRDQLIQNERLAIMGRLLASVSHELNNPLQAIHNALFLLKEEKGLSEQGRQDLDIVLAESERMSGMIERLRDTYRPTRADERKPIQINDIIEDVHALLVPHLRKNRVAFEFHADPNLPLVPAISDQIRQVVLNLFVNGIEAMSAEGGILTARTKFLSDVNEILFSVSDMGSGISESILPDIFEPFITNSPGGTGLGLTISREIVLNHQGRISAENNLNQGAVFRVWLPVQDRESK